MLCAPASALIAHSPASAAALLLLPSVGRPKHVKVMATGAGEGELFVGDRAREMRGILKLSYPTTHGVIQVCGASIRAAWSLLLHFLIATDTVLAALSAGHCFFFLFSSRRIGRTCITSGLTCITN